MAHVQFADLQARPTEFLDFTSLTLDEFQQLVPPFEAAFQAHMAAWRLDGKPRTARQFSVYKNCPFGQNIRTRLPIEGHAFIIVRPWACLPLPSYPYSASRGIAKPEGE